MGLQVARKRKLSFPRNIAHRQGLCQRLFEFVANKLFLFLSDRYDAYFIKCKSRNLLFLLVIFTLYRLYLEFI